VITAGCLLLYSLAVLRLGPPRLRRMTRSGEAPRLGVTAWLTAIGSVLIAWVAAAVTFVVEIARHWNHPELVVLSCLDGLHGIVTGHHGTALQAAALAVAAAVSVAVAVTAVRVAAAMMRLRVRAHHHAQAVRLVGRCTAEPDVVVVDAAKAAAYCVSGRPPAIVVTSAALAALQEDQLCAVLAHERAHLAGHHPNVVAALRSLAAVFPSLALMTEGAAAVARLLEMCADDAAARRHGSAALLSGLMALAGAAPAEALAAADVAVLTRAERLTAPPVCRAQARARAALSSAVTIMVAGAVITTVLALSGALTCGP
jgi:Zn-dependent protease with chaperone function